MRIHSCVAVAAIAAFSLVAASPDAQAKRRGRRPATIVSVESPSGLVGMAGSGANVVLPFTVADRRGAATDVQVEYGIDRNADGTITDDEFRPATEDRLDVRNTRSDSAPQLYVTGSDGGALNSYVWKSTADVSGAAFLLTEFALTNQGRLIPDLGDPTGYRRAVGPGGTPQFAGVKFRARAVVARGRRGRVRGSDWVESDAFALDHRRAPSMTIDSVESGSVVLVDWTVFDADSEDFDGNGQLDVADGEDVNGNGQLDDHRVGVAFDFCSLAPGQDVSSMTEAELARLQWRPCTRLATLGDTDSLATAPGVPPPAGGDLAGVPSAPPGVGRSWLFAWNAVADLGTVVDDVILRATPFDQTRARGRTVYWPTRVHPGE